MQIPGFAARAARGSPPGASKPEPLFTRASPDPAGRQEAVRTTPARPLRPLPPSSAPPLPLRTPARAAPPPGRGADALRDWGGAGRGEGRGRGGDGGGAPSRAPSLWERPSRRRHSRRRRRGLGAPRHPGPLGAAAAGGTWRPVRCGAAASAAWAGCRCSSSPSWSCGPTTRTWWSSACVSTRRGPGVAPGVGPAGARGGQGALSVRRAVSARAGRSRLRPVCSGRRRA